VQEEASSEGEEASSGSQKAGGGVDPYLMELHEDRQLLELLDVKVEDAAVGMLLLEALSINALWDFGIVFEQVRPQLRICCMHLVIGTSRKDAASSWSYSIGHTLMCCLSRARSGHVPTF
jgi:hypothetical protein